MSESTTRSLSELAMDGDFATLEEKWMAAVESGFRDLDDYFRAADTTIASSREDVAGPLLAMLLEALDAGDPDEETADFAKKALLLSLGDASVRKVTARIHERAGRRELGVILEKLGPGGSDAHRARLETCLRLEPGTFVAGKERVGPERVERFDPDTGKYYLTDGKSERELEPTQAADELSVIPDDDFRARLRFDVEALVVLAQEDPSGLVRAALRSSNRRLEWQDLKKLMARGVVAQNAFARWWNKAKGHVERDPMITVYGDRQPTMILREEAIRHEAELDDKIQRAESDFDRIMIVLGYMRALDQGHDVDTAFLRDCANLLADLTGEESTPIPVALAAASVHDDVRVRIADDGGDVDNLNTVEDEALIARVQSLTDAPAVLSDEELLRRALFYLRTRSDDKWAHAFASALPSAPARLSEALAKELLAEDKGTELATAIQSILASPDRHGEGLFWLWKAATSKTLEDAPCRIDRVAITLALLRLMNRWARTAKSQISDSQRALLSKMRSAVPASSYRAMNKVLDELPEDQAVAMYAAVNDNLGLTDAARHHLQESLKAKYHDTILGKKEPWEQDVIFVSPRGLRSRQEEFNQIVNVEMVKNSEAIGVAADFGDLSENAEFTAALEQRDFLSRRANEIGEELNKAAIIPGDLDTSCVNIGTRVRLRDNKTGAIEVYTFLGPWDADLEQRIYSYQAPFASVLMGKTVGDEVEVAGEADARLLEVIEVEPAEIPS